MSIYCVKSYTPFKTSRGLLQHRDTNACHKSALKNYTLPLPAYLSLTTRGPLNEAQECAVEQFVSHFSNGPLEVTDRMITTAANDILRRSHEGEGAPKYVDQSWTAGFLARHPWFEKRYRDPPAVEEEPRTSWDGPMGREPVYWKTAIEEKQRSRKPSPTPPPTSPTWKEIIKERFPGEHEGVEDAEKEEEGPDLVLHALQQALLAPVCEEIRELFAELDLWKNKQDELMKFVEEYKHISPELPRIAELQIQPSLPYLLCTIEMSRRRGHAASEEESVKMREESEMLQLKAFGRRLESRGKAEKIEVRGGREKRKLEVVLGDGDREGETRRGKGRRGEGRQNLNRVG